MPSKSELRRHAHGNPEALKSMERPMSEDEATADLKSRGVWRMAPGLWCDASVPDLIAVDDEVDNATTVRKALQSAGTLPPVL